VRQDLIPGGLTTDQARGAVASRNDRVLEHYATRIREPQLVETEFDEAVHPVGVESIRQTQTTRGVETAERG